MAGKNLRSMREESESKIVLIGASSPGQDDNFGGKIQEGSDLFCWKVWYKSLGCRRTKKESAHRRTLSKNFRSVDAYFNINIFLVAVKLPASMR